MCVDLKRHFNWLKVAVMVLLAVMVMMFVLTGTQSAYAGTDNKTYVIDDAGILTSEEEQKLTDMCRKASKNCQLDIVIITMNRNLDYSPMIIIFVQYLKNSMVMRKQELTARLLYME